MTAAVPPRMPPEPWLETIAGDSPVLLIAPHGGRAGEAARATLHPKVNDLYTAEITRELAARLGASALINAAMDRNQLDCNRISQLAAQAPWMLDLIAERLEAIVDRFGRAIVLLIHGWNIIEPRIDFGLGVRRRGDELLPAGSARVSATDEFINGPMAALARRLRMAGIASSFGMRYPAGGINNLVQAFTDRHRESQVPALRRIASIASERRVDTAQLELSVSVRMEGPLRRGCLDAITETFSPTPAGASSERSALQIVRTARPAARASPSAAPVMPSRVGLEFFDPQSRIGAMASFDVGAPGFGARIMMIVGERRVILCTCEGTTVRESDRLALGPLSLALRGDSLALTFSGPAVVVPDGSKYLSIESALATGRLDPDVRVAIEVPLGAGKFDPSVLFDPRSAPAGSAALFALCEGRARVEGIEYRLRASTRAGVSFTGLGPQRFNERRMVWAMFDGEAGSPHAIELRYVDGYDGSSHHHGRALSDVGWSGLRVERLAIETSAPDTPPHRLEAAALDAEGDRLDLRGIPLAFVPLSRPGPNGSRIYTSLGFGTYRWGERLGCGMFEYSRRAQGRESSEEADSD